MAEQSIFVPHNRDIVKFNGTLSSKILDTIDKKEHLRIIVTLYPWIIGKMFQTFASNPKKGKLELLRRSAENGNHSACERCRSKKVTLCRNGSRLQKLTWGYEASLQWTTERL